MGELAILADAQREWVARAVAWHKGGRVGVYPDVASDAARLAYQAAGSAMTVAGESLRVAARAEITKRAAQ